MVAAQCSQWSMESVQHMLKQMLFGWLFESHSLVSEDRLRLYNKLVWVYSEHRELQNARSTLTSR